MSTLDEQVARARRRLNLNLFLQHAALGVLVATALWTAALLVERSFVLHIPLWHGIWAATLLAFLIGLVGTQRSRVDALRAAVAVDQAAGLKERLSSGLAVRGSVDPFARLVVRDAEHTAAQVHVPAHLPYRPPSLWPWSAACVVAAVILGALLPELNLLAGQSDPEAAARREDAAVEHRAIRSDLDARFSKIREMAENNPALKDLAKDLEPLELPDEPTLTPDDVRREAARQIDKVTERLAAQKEEALLDAMRDTARMLSRLDPQQGQRATDKLSQSLAQGDFSGARRALEELQKELEQAAAEDGAEAQARLQQMQQQLKRLADQLAQLDDALYMRKELERRAGLSEEDARKLLERLSQLDPKQLEKELQQQLGQKLSSEQIQELVKRFQQQQEARKTCQNLGQCLAQAAQALQQAGGSGGGSASAQAAAAALGDALGHLSELEMAEQLLNEIEAQLADLRNLREGVCRGAYCRAQALRQNMICPQGPEYGLGIGARIGEERVAHAIEPTRVKSRMRGGTIIGQMLVDGPQMRGEATAEVREAVNAAERDALDAIERDAVPRQYHDAVKKYFDRLAGLLSDRQASSGPDDAAASPKHDSDPKP